MALYFILSKLLTGNKVSNFSPTSSENRHRTQAIQDIASLEMRKLSPVNP
jgi:hypothetical protein